MEMKTDKKTKRAASDATHNGGRGGAGTHLLAADTSQSYLRRHGTSNRTISHAAAVLVKVF